MSDEDKDPEPTPELKALLNPVEAGKYADKNCFMCFATGIFSGEVCRCVLISLDGDCNV